MLKLYYAKTDLVKEQKVFDALFEKMNAQRKEKILRCKNESDKQRSLLAGYLLKLALEQEGYSYEILTFSKTEKGKPFIQEVKQLYFSLSHSGEYVLCIVSDREVGVDIESKEKRLFSETKKETMYSVARKILTDKELERLEGASAEYVPSVFLEYWTKKESYSKAVGEGLGMDFKTVETDTNMFFTKWLNDSYCMSIYLENAGFEELQMYEVTNLHK